MSIPQFVIEGKRLEKPDGIPNDYWNIIEKCWKHIPEDRPFAFQVYEMLKKLNVNITHTTLN